MARLHSSYHPHIRAHCGELRFYEDSRCICYLSKNGIDYTDCVTCSGSFRTRKTAPLQLKRSVQIPKFCDDHPQSFLIGEALNGEGNEVAHIDLLIGSRRGPVGIALANGIANQSAGHSSLFVNIPNTLLLPATLTVTKVSIKGAKQAVHMFGPAQAAVFHAIGHELEKGAFDAITDDINDLAIVVGVFVHWQAEDNKKIFSYNYNATRIAVGRAIRREPNREAVIAMANSGYHPFVSIEKEEFPALLAGLKKEFDKPATA